MQIFSPIKHRILKTIENKGISKYEFYQKSGITRGVLDKDSGISEENITKFIAYFPEVSLEWLITGKGEMYKEKAPAVIPTKESFTPKVVTMDTSGRDNVIMVPAKVRAGYLAGYGDTAFIGSLQSYHMPGIGPGIWRDFEVSGLSMYPTINDKDRIVCKYVEQIDDIKDNRIYVVVHSEEGVIVKRMINRVKEDSVLICKSDNKPQYPNIVIEPQDIKEVWDVKYLITRHLDDPNILYQQVGDLEARLTLLEHQIAQKL